MRLLIFTYIFYANCTFCSAQKILKHLATDEGLSEITCFDIFQDSKGYMWIGTSAGANTYDGKDVISFERSTSVKEQNNSFNIKDINGVLHLLKTNEIKFIKSSGNYLEYHTDNKKYVSRMTMSNAVEKFKIWTDFD